MLRVKKPIYFQRFQRHIKSLEKHLKEGDYVQAAEKVWGAISSLVNAYFKLERKNVEGKKQGFDTLFRQLSVKHPSLRKILKENGFNNPYSFASKASGLHEYFYGGRKYPEEYLKSIIAKCATVLKELNTKISMQSS